MRYVDPNQSGSKVEFKAQYDNFIGGEWVAPVKGEYFENISPVDGKVFTKVPHADKLAPHLSCHHDIIPELVLVGLQRYFDYAAS